MSITLEVKEAKLAYGTKVVVPRISLSVDRPEIVSIIGPNGSGKSTLLKGLARLLAPAAGGVFLDGRDINKLPTLEVARKMAILPQSVNSPGDMTVKDLIICGRAPYRSAFGALSKEDNSFIDEAIELTDLQTYQHRRIDTLSGGERQRAWLAMALAQNPRLLLLDEPTSYLDIRHQLELMQLIGQLYEKKRITVLMVLHDLNHAARYSHRIIAMKDGAVRADGPTKKVFTHETLKFLYDVEVVVMDLAQKGGSSLVCFAHSVCSD